MAAPGWYTDKQDRRLARWYDGEIWTEHTVVIEEWVGRGTPPPPDQLPPTTPALDFGSPPAHAAPPPAPGAPPVAGLPPDPAPGPGRTPAPSAPPPGPAPGSGRPAHAAPPPDHGPPPTSTGYSAPPPSSPPPRHGPPPVRRPAAPGQGGFDLSALASLSLGEKVIAGSGLVTFIAAFLPWFSITVFGRSGHASGWDIGFFWAGLPALVGLALAALLVAQAVAGVELPELPVTRGQALLGAGAVVAAIVLLKLLTGYHGTDRSIGLFLAVLSTLGMAGGGYLVLQDESRR